MPKVNKLINKFPAFCEIGISTVLFMAVNRRNLSQEGWYTAQQTTFIFKIHYDNIIRFMYSQQPTDVIS
jgi:hypothetical protein